MPCYKLEKSLTSCRARDKAKDRNVLAPRPVHPRPISTHGLLGLSYLRQHMMVDERWTPNSLTEEFTDMSNLLARRAVFKSHESKANRQRYITESKRLKQQCHDGRIKLQKVLAEDTASTIRNYLINHKDMQRLYQKMPIDLVVDNINQRTFGMRKERDRLRSRLGQLKERYKNLLIKHADLENRIKYQNEFVLEEEIKSGEFVKRIENSNVRLKAIKAINATYKKMIQVLRYDAIFYEPILRSLDNDMEDQANFIKHILHLGFPAIAKFRDLSMQFRRLEDQSRKNLQAKLLMLSSFMTLGPNPHSILTTHAKGKPPIPSSADPKRYLRETRSMLVLKLVLESIENTIKEVKFVTLCSQTKEIYPRMKCQVDNNQKLHHIIECDMLAHESLEGKMKFANVLKGVLVNNLSAEEINRLDHIKELRNTLVEEDKLEQATLTYLKNRGDAFVMLRVSIWNLIDIMRHVDRQPKLIRSEYPNSYLKLPLLKFEMLNMRAVVPEIYEENMSVILHVLKRKLYKLMRVYPVEITPEEIVSHREDYHADYVASTELYEPLTQSSQQNDSTSEDLIAENKIMANVPSRKQVKAQSSKFLEELAKRD